MYYVFLQTCLMGFCGPKIQYQKMHLQMQQKMQIHLRHVLLAHRFLPASWCGFSYWPAEWGSPIGPLTRVLFFASWLGFSYWPADFSYWSPADSSSFLCQLIQVLLLASWSKFSYWPNESSPLIGQRMESIPFARLFSFSSCPAFSDFLALQYYCIIGYWFLRYCHFKKNIYLVHSGSERMLACWTVELCWWLGQLLDTKLLV